MTRDGGNAPVVGVVLAAGAGQRYGGPKALVPGWLEGRCRALRDGGCSDVLVVLGAAAEEARALVPDDAHVVVAQEWAEGMGGSLREALTAAAAIRPFPDAVLVALVDVPGLTSEAVHRMLQVAGPAPAACLAQATYDGQRGHPVLIGRAHWAGVRQAATGDRGARDYLAGRDVRLVECGDVADGRDVDEPE